MLRVPISDLGPEPAPQMPEAAPKFLLMAMSYIRDRDTLLPPSEKVKPPDANPPWLDPDRHIDRSTPPQPGDFKSAQSLDPFETAPLEDDPRKRLIPMPGETKEEYTRRQNRILNLKPSSNPYQSA